MQRTIWSRFREAGRWSWYSGMAQEVPPEQAKSGELVIEDQEYRARLGANSP